MYAGRAALSTPIIDNGNCALRTTKTPLRRSGVGCRQELNLSDGHRVSCRHLRPKKRGPHQRRQKDVHLHRLPLRVCHRRRHQIRLTVCRLHRHRSLQPSAESYTMVLCHRRIHRHTPGLRNVVRRYRPALTGCKTVRASNVHTKAWSFHKNHGSVGTVCCKRHHRTTVQAGCSFPHCLAPTDNSEPAGCSPGMKATSVECLGRRSESFRIRAVSWNRTDAERSSHSSVRFAAVRERCWERHRPGREARSSATAHREARRSGLRRVPCLRRVAFLQLADVARTVDSFAERLPAH